MKSMEQKRAQKAWECVNDAKQALKSNYDDYKNLAKSAPALIKTNGLMQTVAFFKEKGKGHHKRLADDVMQWVWTHVKRGNGNASYKDFMDWLVSTDVATYMAATQEALEILKWIRHLAGTL